VTSLIGIIQQNVRNVGPYEEREKEGKKQQEGRAKTIGRRNERARHN